MWANAFDTPINRVNKISSALILGYLISAISIIAIIKIPY